MAVTEPRFTPREKALLLASWRADREPRGRHGFLLSEATDPDVQWEVGMPVRDYAQQALDKAEDDYEAQWGKAADMRSLLFRVRRKG